MPDCEAFERAVMADWPEMVPDCFGLQGLAVEHGLLSEIEGGFDPSKHHDELGALEPGDELLERNYDDK